MKKLAFGLVFLVTAPVFASNDVLFSPVPSRQAQAAVTADDFFASETLQKSQDEVLKRAEEKVEETKFLDPTLKKTIVESLRELPFQRFIDVQLSFFSGMPDLVGLCLEAHPINNQVAVEACAATAILFSSVIANVKYRWDLVLKRNSKNRIHQLSVGPGFGARAFKTICFDTCNQGWMLEAMGSLEYVYWINRHFGFEAQLDLGTSYILSEENPSIKNTGGFVQVPTGRITIGLSF